MNSHIMNEDFARANERARKRKIAQDKEVAAKKKTGGVLIVYTGAGKGKSTAAFGSAHTGTGARTQNRRCSIHQRKVEHGRAIVLSAASPQGQHRLFLYGRRIHMGDSRQGTRH